ncbi:MAG: DUF1499 domain-containing protein [Pseudomonadota bacterium]
MKLFTTLFVILPLLVCGLLYYLSMTSTAPKLGVRDHHLLPCTNSGACVTSESAFGADLDPLNASESKYWERLPEVVRQDGGKIRSDTFGYIHATYTSTVFRFVDDIEFRLDEAGRVIHVRSSSRVGKSDLGANRRRVERIRARLRDS